MVYASFGKCSTNGIALTAVYAAVATAGLPHFSNAASPTSWAYLSSAWNGEANTSDRCLPPSVRGCHVRACETPVKASMVGMCVSPSALVAAVTPAAATPTAGARDPDTSCVAASTTGRTCPISCAVLPAGARASFRVLGAGGVDTSGAGPKASGEKPEAPEGAPGPKLSGLNGIV